jgi:hypothetical protein
MRAKKDILCHILHGVLAGLVTVLFNWFGLAVSIFLFIQFISYEMAEERKIQDELYLELKEWTLGYATVLAIGVILKCISISSF